MTKQAKKDPVKFKRLIPDNRTLRSNMHTIGEGDLFIGRIRLKPGEEHLLMYLEAKGVTVFPSLLSQMLNRSKTMQTLVFSDLMLPGTCVIHDLHDLVELMSVATARLYSRVVTKHDRRNGGMGINLWPTLEDVFNQVSLGALPVPFVIQPYISDSRDVRIIVINDYRESYWRHNPNNFRNNLHFGGRSDPLELSREQNEICDLAMKRGEFPYAHIDLMVTPDDRSYLAEISLQGGIRGAVIDGETYRKKIKMIHQGFRSRSGIGI